MIIIFEGLDLIRCVTHDPRGGLAKVLAAARHWFGLCFSGLLLLALWSVLISHVHMMTQETGFGRWSAKICAQIVIWCSVQARRKLGVQ
jgi:hypothetical protein